MTQLPDVLRFKDGYPVPLGWQKESMMWRGVILVGYFAHYCHDWDYLPVDETTPEYECCTCGPPCWYVS